MPPLASNQMLEYAYEIYTGSCEGGDSSPDTNCAAHSISNALIKARFTIELEGPITAEQLRGWAETMFECHDTAGTGVYFVYQGRESDGQGHVLLMKYPDGDLKGQTFYESDENEVWHTCYC